VVSPTEAEIIKAEQEMKRKHINQAPTENVMSPAIWLTC
jgi:glycine/serine hydroxymethyltransferase